MARKIQKNANHLSSESAGDSFARSATAIVRQFSFGAGGGDRFGAWRERAMGVAGPGRTAPGSNDRAPDRDAPAGLKG